MITVLLVGTKKVMGHLLRRLKNETIYQVHIVRTIALAMVSARSMPHTIIVTEGLDITSLGNFLGEYGINSPVHVINPEDPAQVEHVVTHLKGGS